MHVQNQFKIVIRLKKFSLVDEVVTQICKIKLIFLENYNEQIISSHIDTVYMSIGLFCYFDFLKIMLRL